MALVLLPLLAVVGVVLLAVGLHGRRVDDHPICRRCGFDLFGLPPGAQRCSECGADLGRGRAVRIGRRERRTVLAAAGAVLLLPSVFGPAAWLAVAGLADPVWLARHKPVWLLVREAEDDRDPALGDTALAQLASRGAGGDLDTEQLDDLAERALARQADASRRWTSLWGDLFLRNGRFTRAQWAQYQRNYMAYRLDVRPAVKAVHNADALVLEGAPILLTIHAEQRLARGNILWPGELRVTRLTIGPVEHQPAHWPHQFRYQDQVGTAQEHSLYLEVRLSRAEWARLGVGKQYDVRLHVEQVKDLDRSPAAAAAYTLSATARVGAPVP